MPNWSIYSNQNHLGNVDASNNEEAIRIAHNLYQNVPNLRVENNAVEDNKPKGNAADYTMSKTEMQKMIRQMAGR